MWGKGLCHRLRSAIGGTVFPKFDGTKIVGIGLKDREWWSFSNSLFLVYTYHFFQLSQECYYLLKFRVEFRRAFFSVWIVWMTEKGQCFVSSTQIERWNSEETFHFLRLETKCPSVRSTGAQHTLLVRQKAESCLDHCDWYLHPRKISYSKMSAFLTVV